MINLFVLFEFLLVSCLGFACAWFDVRERRIPAWLGYLFLALGLLLGLRSVSGLAGVLAALAFGFVLWKRGVWGAGDARFLAGLQAWSLVVVDVKWFFLIVFLVAAALFFVWLVLTRERLSLANLFVKTRRHSFALFLLLGFFVVVGLLFCGEGLATCLK